MKESEWRRWYLSLTAGTDAVVDLAVGFLPALRTGFYVHLRVPHFVAIPFAVETTDFIVTAPEKLGAALAQRLAIRVVPHPIKLPEFQVNQFWHRRFCEDADNKWLRSVFTMLFRE